MRKQQGGFFLIEALVAILIFSLGILGMISMGSAAIAGQTDAQVRTDAATFADELAGQIALSVNRLTDDAATSASLAPFAHHPTPGGYCTFGGAASADPVVTAWLGRLTGPGGLPGATAARQSIAIDTSLTGYNQVMIAICWRGQNDNAMRRFMTTAYVNR